VSVVKIPDTLLLNRYGLYLLVIQMRILVAEDDESIMKTYKLLFKSIAHDLFTATDGEECIRIFDDEARKLGSTSRPQSLSEEMTAPFDLVILDYRMPKKNGVEVADHILSKARSQRIIIASAYTHELSESQQNRGSNKLEMIQKPFEFDALLQLVEKK